MQCRLHQSLVAPSALKNAQTAALMAEICARKSNARNKAATKMRRSARQQ
jgi:hypothetical protein